MASEVVEVTKVNCLDVTKKFITYVVVPENGTFYHLLAKSNFLFVASGDLGGRQDH